MLEAVSQIGHSIQHRAKTAAMSIQWTGLSGRSEFTLFFGCLRFPDSKTQKVEFNVEKVSLKSHVVVHMLLCYILCMSFVKAIHFPFRLCILVICCLSSWTKTVLLFTTKC